MIPAREIETINAMIGVPISYNLAFVQTDNVSSMDAEILIALKPEHAPDRRRTCSGSARCWPRASPAATSTSSPPTS